MTRRVIDCPRCRGDDAVLIRFLALHYCQRRPVYPVTLKQWHAGPLLHYC